MSLKSPLVSPELRRNWEVIGAVVVLALFTLGHFIAFEPIARRYQMVSTRAAALGLSLNPAPRANVTHRVAVLLAAHSLPADEATRRGDTGRLTEELLGELTKIAATQGVRIVSAEPGQVKQLPNSVHASAHVHAMCSYASLVGLLDALARSQSLIQVDRFIATPGESGRHDVELWVSRLTIKQGGGK